ncbi:Fic family protein [Pseudomonas fluorescens]|uniref:Fic family protein n=1 Tax=Pseudomonas fluorescens TaxID=294 RepID=UPI003D02E068
MSFITHKSWLDPILPEDLPASILTMADRLPYQAGFLAGRFAPETALRISRLLRVTNTYYSNLIEGHYTEPAEMQRAQNAPRKDRKLLRDLAIQHMHAQESFERLIRRSPDSEWAEMFAPELIGAVHRRLFEGTLEESRLLSDGTPLVPGEMRSLSGREVIVGDHTAPAASAVDSMLRHLQTGFGNAKDLRRQLIGALAYHHRLAFVHPFADGNGRVARMITHLQLVRLGLGSGLWSLSRGLARRHEEYYRYLALADRPRTGDLDGRGQMSRKHYFEFIEFMLDVCNDQIEYMTSALNPEKLSARVLRAFKTNEHILDRGIRGETAKAVHTLIVQGSMPRNDFKTFTGLPPRAAIDQLGKLIDAGLVESETPKSRTVTPGFPVWFAQDVFPDLHHRIK